MHCGVEHQPARKTVKLTRHACMKEAVFDGFYRAKPVSEPKRSGGERALRSRTTAGAKDGKADASCLHESGRFCRIS